MADEQYLEEAIDELSKTLVRKKDAWANNMSVFECFDAQREFHDDPIAFALKMCNLKMIRVRSCLNRHMTSVSSCPTYLSDDADLEDSIRDLAGYAVLARAMLLREQATKTEDILRES